MLSKSQTDELIHALSSTTDSKAQLQVIYQAYLNDRGDLNSLAEVLAEQHNYGSIDVVLAFSDLVNDSSSTINFFLCRSIFEKVLPHITASVETVMNCVLHLINEAGQDLSANMPLNSFGNYLSSNKLYPTQALELLKQKADKYSSLTMAILVADSKFSLTNAYQEAICLCNHSNIQIQNSALFALGCLEYEDSLDMSQKALDSIKSIVTKATDDHLLANSIKSTFELLQKDKSLLSDANRLIDHALEKGDDLSLHAASYLIAFYSKELADSTIDILLKHLRQVDPSHASTLENIDYGITEILKSDKYEDGIEFLEDLLIINQGKVYLTAFGSTTRLLLTHKENFLGHIITRWFLRGQRELWESIGSIFEQYPDQEPLIYLKTEELAKCKPYVLIFLARKVIGYLFFNSVSASSAIISIMASTSDATTIEILSNLLFNPLLINYSGKVSEYLENQVTTQKNPQIIQAIERSLNLFRVYIDDLKSIGNIPELYPSQEQREIYARHFSRQVAEAIKNAEKQSVFAHLLHKSVILYGRKSINYIQDTHGKVQRIETVLQKFSNEVETSRLENIDPFSLEYMIKVFQFERLNNHEADN